MSIRLSRRLAMCIASILTMTTVVQTGCCSRCGTSCTPRGLWQSPSIRATRALLLVDMPELHILRVDGKNVRPSCVGEGGVREYYLTPGPHRITASFRYQDRVGAGLIGAVEGEPLTLEHTFDLGQEYVAIYSEHAYPKPEPESLGQAIALALAPRQEAYWSMSVVNLADAAADADPAVQRAQLYCSLLRIEAASAKAY